jgi:hypothetical protein
MRPLWRSSANWRARCFSQIETCHNRKFDLKYLNTISVGFALLTNRDVPGPDNVCLGAKGGLNPHALAGAATSRLYVCRAEIDIRSPSPNFGLIGLGGLLVRCRKLA